MGVPPSEIFLHLNVTKLYGEESCRVYQDGEPARFAYGLFICAAICWILCFASLVGGTKSIQAISVVTNLIKVILLFVMMAQFMALNSDAAGKGIDYYLRAEPFPLPPDDPPALPFRDIVPAVGPGRSAGPFRYPVPPPPPFAMASAKEESSPSPPVLYQPP